MGMKTVAIIGALDEEVALIAKSLTHVTHTAKGSLDIVSGTVDSFGSDVIKVAATVGGMGLVNAAATTQLLIDRDFQRHRRQPQHPPAHQRRGARRHPALPRH